MTGLLVPAHGPATLARVAAELAAENWQWPLKWVDTFGGQAVLWCGERRRVHDLPVNAAALALAARLGCPDLADRIGLNGDLLLAGAGPDNRPIDVPASVVRAAQRAGLLQAPDRDDRAGAQGGAIKAVRPWTGRA